MTTVVIREAAAGSTTVVEREVVRVLTGDAQGPAGPQGPIGPAASSFVTYPADIAISGHRIVRSNQLGRALYADSSTLADANAVIGLTLNAALAGDPVNIQVAGEVQEPSWSWTVGLPVFLGANGLPTQVATVTGFQLIVGVATASDRLVLGIKQPIIL